jgi:hypothetical protein
MWLWPQLHQNKHEDSNVLEIWGRENLVVYHML